MIQNTKYIDNFIKLKNKNNTTQESLLSFFLCNIQCILHLPVLQHQQPNYFHFHGGSYQAKEHSLWKIKTRVTSREVRVQIYELQFQICKLRVQIHELLVQIHELGN